MGEVRFKTYQARAVLVVEGTSSSAVVDGTEGPLVDGGVEAPMAKTASQNRLGVAFIPPGEPWRSGYIESFNSRVRVECLSINIVWSLAHARVVIGDLEVSTTTDPTRPQLPAVSPLRRQLSPPITSAH